MNRFLDRVFFGNTVEAYLWFLGIILAGLILKRLVSIILTRVVFRIVKKYSTGVGFEKLLALLERPLGLLVMLITLYLACLQLDFPASWRMAPVEKVGWKMVIYRTYQTGVIFAVTWAILRLVDFFGLILMHRASLTESKTDDQLVPFIRESIKIVIVILSVFFALGAVFHLNIASLVAGLGIGGIAVALAAKESLENLFGSFTIFLDKPFIVGDLVKIGNVTGNIERIGFRSTRLRTVDKTYVTIPNKKMVDGELDNLTLRTFRRASFYIGLTYDTQPEKLKAVVDQLKAFLEDHPMMQKGENHVRFYDFAASSLNIRVEYLVNTIDWVIYLSVREEVNYKIIEIVSGLGCEFAFPTTTVIMDSGKKQEEKV
jgi:MscS family membrane protein